MRTRAVSLLDYKNLKERYAVKVYVNGKWLFLGDSNGLCIFDTPEEQADARAEMRKRRWPPEGQEASP